MFQEQGNGDQMTRSIKVKIRKKDVIPSRYHF